jgi:hypothetical protein
MIFLGEMESFSNLFGKPVVCANKCDRGGSSVVFVADWQRSCRCIWREKNFGIIMSMKTYERQMALVDVYKKLAEAEKQIINGAPLLDGEEVFQKLRDKYVLFSMLNLYR